MRQGTFLVTGSLAAEVKAMPETGMGYVVATITLNDGSIIPQVVINGGYVSRVRGIPDVPFDEGDIASIKATHEKWDWTEEP